MMLLTLRGSVFLYEGDEIGMVDTPLEQEQMKDPVSIQLLPGVRPRRRAHADAVGGHARARGSPSRASSRGCPFGDLSVNVEDQRRDPESFLSLCRDLIGGARRAA